MSSIDNPSSETPTAENPFAPPTAGPSAPDVERMQTGTGDLTKTGTRLTLVLFGTLVSAGVLAIGFTVAGVAFGEGWVLLEWTGGVAAILGFVGVLIGGLMLLVGSLGELRKTLRGIGVPVEQLGEKIKE